MVSFSTPLSLYSIPVVWFTSFYPAALRSSLLIRTIGFDNTRPRQNLARLSENKDISSAIADRAARMEGAHLNGNENFPLWAIAVLAANFAGVDHKILNMVSLSYISLRVMYNYVYINQQTKAQSLLRTRIYFISLPLPFYLLIAAANLIRGSQSR